MKGIFTPSAFMALAMSVAATPSVNVNGASYDVHEIIERDVVVIGGGSTGTYAAIGILDSGKSVAVVEEKGRLGGHTETYVDPTTGIADDYGVVVLHNTSFVRNYAARLNVTLGPGSAGAATTNTLYADFRTGVENNTFAIANFTAGLAIYVEQLLKYPYVETGFDLPDPVPADLLLSFGDFAEKYALGEHFLGFLFNFAQGLGDLLAHPTLYVFKNFGIGVIQGLQSGYLAATGQDGNSLFYDHATTILGQDVLFNSTILAVDRSGDCARVLVETPTGTTCIDAKKLVFTIPPKIDNLKGWDLSSSEQSLFQQFNNSGYFAAVVSNTGLPAGLSVINRGTNNENGFPDLPGVYTISPGPFPDSWNVWYGSATTTITDAQIQGDIIASLERLQIANKTTTTPNILSYARHAPFELWVPSTAIANGFYKDLYGLQGQRHTYYTGAAFHTHDSALLWEFTAALLPNIAAT